MSDAGGMQATITLQGVSLTASVGATAPERALPQRLTLDCVLRYDAGVAAARDRLSDAVDYAAVTEALRGVIAERPRRLLETAAADCAEAVLVRYGAVSEVEISLTKHGIPPGVERTSVRVVRRRAEQPRAGSTPRAPG